MPIQTTENTILENLFENRLEEQDKQQKDAKALSPIQFLHGFNVNWQTGLFFPYLSGS